jgi:hypothetical protein
MISIAQDLVSLALARVGKGEDEVVADLLRAIQRVLNIEQKARDADRPHSN